MPGRNGFVQMMDALAKVPAEGLGEPQGRPSPQPVIHHNFVESGATRCYAADPDANRRLSQQHMHQVIAADTDLGLQLRHYGQRCVMQIWSRRRIETVVLAFLA